MARTQQARGRFSVCHRGRVRPGNALISAILGRGDIWIAKLDKHGKYACGSVDKCKGLKVSQDCADGNLCTYDWCDEAKGCTNPLVPDGTYCAKNSTCVLGACVKQ